MKGRSFVYIRVCRDASNQIVKKRMNMNKQIVSIRGDSNLLIVQHTFLFFYIYKYHFWLYSLIHYVLYSSMTVEVQGKMDKIYTPLNVCIGYLEVNVSHKKKEGIK